MYNPGTKDGHSTVCIYISLEEWGVGGDGVGVVRQEFMKTRVIQQ